jgi:serine/threonine protein kinase
MEQIDMLNDIILSDHYEFKSVLGHGAFGLVVEAYSETLETNVAIKVFLMTN